MEPNRAVPSEPPMPRSIVTPDVAAPSTAYSTAFCTASTSTCMVMPRPSPSTSRYAAEVAALVSTSSRERSRKPSAESAVPAIGKAL